MNEPNSREPEPTQNGGNHISGDEHTTPPGNALLDGLKLALKIFIWIVVCVVGSILVLMAILFAGCVCANGGKL